MTAGLAGTKATPALVRVLTDSDVLLLVQDQSPSRPTTQVGANCQL
jgi:hypothetical protein